MITRRSLLAGSIAAGAAPTLVFGHGPDRVCEAESVRRYIEMVSTSIAALPIQVIVIAPHEAAFLERHGFSTDGMIVQTSLPRTPAACG